MNILSKELAQILTREIAVLPSFLENEKSLDLKHSKKTTKPSIKTLSRGTRKRDEINVQDQSDF